METRLKSRDADQRDTQPFRMSRLGRHSLIYGIGTVASRIVGFLMLPVYTRILTPADYGVLQLVAMVVEIIAIVAGTRIAGGVYRFYHKAETPSGRHVVLSTALVVIALSFATITVAAGSFAPLIADIVFGSRGPNVLFVRLACAALLFEGMVLVPLAHLQLGHRSILFVVVQIIKLLLTVILNLIFLIPLRMGVTGVLLSTLIANSIIGTSLAVRLVRVAGFHFALPVAGRLLRFGVPLMATQVSTFVLTFGDRYFLNKAGGAGIVGLYGLAYQFAFLLFAIGYWPFARSWEPTRFEVAERPDRDEIYARAFLYLNIFVITVGVGLALFSKDLLRIMSAPSFHGAANLIPGLLLASVLHTWTMFLNLGIYIKERTEFDTLATWSAALVALAGYVWLIPRFLAWGAVLSTIAAYAVRHGMIYGFSQHLWPVRYRWVPVIRVLAAGMVVSTAGALAPDTAIGVSLLIRSGLFILYLVAIWSLGILSESERAFIRWAVRSPRAAGSALIR